MKRVIFYGLLLISTGAFSQVATIIDMSKENGTFTIRDNKTGRIQCFKPDALEGAELKVGDTVTAVFDTKKITAVKGITRSYDLMQAAYGDSCCVILKLDSVLHEPYMMVTAKNNSTGENIQFNVPKMLGSKLNAGGWVFTQPTHGYAMIAAAGADSTQKDLFGFPMLQESPKK